MGYAHQRALSDKQQKWVLNSKKMIKQVKQVYMYNDEETKNARYEKGLMEMGS